MRSLLALSLLLVAACGPSTPTGPAVTCPDVQLETAAGSCDLVGTQQCSDGNFYEIDCQDDGTCTCSENGMITMSLFVEDGSGYCATFDASLFHSLSVDCGWNLNP
jgi:DNA-directed RNA polymerase alpha subunit